MGCTCSKVQNEEGINRCRRRKRAVKNALKWRNQYAAAHSEYMLALANMGAAFRNFTDGEFRDQLHLSSSSSSTSSSTSTPIPRTPTTPLTSTDDEIVNRVKLPRMALLSNPPAPVTVVVSPPRTPRGSARTMDQEDEYQRYMEADAPPDGLYSYIKQPNNRSPPRFSEPTSSYAYSSYTSSEGPSSGQNAPSSRPFVTTPSEAPSWDFLGIFHLPPVMELYGGLGSGFKEDEREETKEVVEDEDLPALEAESPQREHRPRRDSEDENRKQQEEKQQEAVKEHHRVSKDELLEEEPVHRAVPQAVLETVYETVEEERVNHHEPVHEHVHERKDKQKAPMEDDEEVVLPPSAMEDVASSSSTHLSDRIPEIIEEDNKVMRGLKNAKIQDAMPAFHSAKDMEPWDALRIIHEQFQKASKSGEEVSRLLEARKAHYNTSFPDGGFSRRSRIFKSMTKPSQWSPKTPLSWNSEDSSSEDFGSTREDVHGHATTLDRLYAWEKKLHAEVKDNDTLNVDYERKCKQLKRLDAKGASNDIVDKAAVAIKMLETQLQVSLQAMKATSHAIQQLTDNELYRQLVELMEKTMLMWGSMSKCHEKQKDAVRRMKKAGRAPLEATSNSHRLATAQLEQALNGWHKSLDSLTNKQREYMRNLSTWLRLSICTPDSRKPEKMPAILNFCGAWASRLDSLQSGDTVEEIKRFAQSIHTIVELQEEEGRIQKRAEVSAKELSKKAHALHNLEKKLVSFPDAELSKDQMDPLEEKKAALEVFRKRVEEEKEKFTRAMQQTRRSTLECLENGLPPLFTRFADYANLCSRSYEELQQERLRSGD